jgi:archaellum component FlaC
MPDTSLRNLFYNLRKMLLESHYEKERIIKEYGNTLTPEIKEKLEGLDKRIKGIQDHINSITNIT